MSTSRPRVLVLGGPPVAAEEVARLLSAGYEVTIAKPGSPEARSGGRGFDLVIGPPTQVARASSPVLEQAAAVLEAIGEGVCLADAQGLIIWANERFRGYEEQTRARIEAVCRRAAAIFIEKRAGGGAEGWPETMKVEAASPDGTRFFEVVVSPVERYLPHGAVTDVMMEGVPGELPPAGAPTGHRAVAVAVVIDATASRRVRQKMEAIDKAGRELVRLDAESVRKMQVGERLQLLEEKIVKFAHDLMHFDHFTIRLLDERTGKLELVVASGLPTEALELEIYSAREGSGITGYVAATGRSYLCPDVEHDPRYLSGLTGARSSLTVPLLLHDKVIGVFNVESERANAFTEEDRQFAEMYATHVALSLHILDLLVVERQVTGIAVTGTVQGELSEPLEDIAREMDRLKRMSGGAQDAELRKFADRIMSDVEAIRKRVDEAAAGPQRILGAEKALVDLAIDPVLVGKRVLVADDEPKIRHVIRDVLGGRGCRVTVCENGEQAIQALEAAKESGEKFSLIVSDIKMPDRNGYEVFAAARRLDAEVPVILMTGFGYDPHHSIVRASQEGLQCVLFKPFQMERLLEEVRKALGAKAGSAS